jgi:hypothetical protein
MLVGDGEPWVVWARYRARLAVGIARQRAVARHVGLFVDFVGARGPDFEPLERRGAFMQAFADALATGTINADGDDPSRLFWLPKSYREARRTLADVTAFGDWLDEQGYAPSLNPTRPATVQEQIVFWHRWNQQKKTALLGHLKTRARDADRARIGREAIIRKTGGHDEGEAKAFPENAIFPLLERGFDRNPRWTTIRDVLITLLLHFGGRRTSEVMHLWVGDVEPDPDDPKKCIPWIQHPEDGTIVWTDPLTGTMKRLMRHQYLQLRHGIQPLTLQTGRRRVGWKKPLTQSEGRMRVFWSDASANRLFWTLYQEYIRIRPRVARHPWLFITPDGDPMTTAGYAKVHHAAVRRIGLIPAKNLGTTPHGHRHAYGHEAEARGLSRKVIQIAMGHRNPFSQEIYKDGRHHMIATEMQAAQDRLTDLKIKGLPQS